MKQISFFDGRIVERKHKSIIRCIKEETRFNPLFLEGNEFEVFKEQGDLYIVDLDNVYHGVWKKDFEVVWKGRS